MSLPEYLAIVQSKFTSGETVVITIEASLMQGWVKAARILAVVNKGSTYALVILLTSRTPPQVYSDLTIEKVLPVDEDFKCDIDADGKQQDGTDVYLNVSSKRVQLTFELRPGIETSTLVAEIFRAIEMYQKKKHSSTQYAWTQELTGIIRNLDAAGDDGHDADTLAEFECPDLIVPRHNIASGKTPVANRDSLVQMQMQLKSNDYTYTEIFRIFIGTWNVNGQAPNGITVEEWLNNDLVAPDLYAIGFQELDLSKEAFLFNDTPREEEWRQVVGKSLHPKATYEQVALVRLVGMMLIVFAQDGHIPFIKNISIDTVGTGIMGKMGNKGGVAVSLSFHNTTICFVNAHLAAHCEEYERRNQDYADICARLSFSRCIDNTTPYIPKGFKDHSQIYWLGDLNYRITEMDGATAKEYINSGQFSPILQLDQLVQQRKLGKVLFGFQEAEIKFKPTYKYDPGSDNWDSSEKGRAPAWCDRVLWKGEAIASVEYRSHPELKISDHKPVSAIFDSQISVIDRVKYRKIHEEVMKKLDKLENEFLPQAMVDATEIIFDTLKFLEPSSKDLIIANTGQVPVQFEFIKKLDDTSYCKDWLHIKPYTGFIKPGEKCDVRLEVLVDKRSACKLNSGEDKLYDILVLHLEGGKDIFITVTGTYERSCFGSSVEALVHIPVPIREVPIGRIIELENNKNPSQEPYAVPKEIWLLVDRLYRHGIKTPGLFEKRGLHSEIIAIRDWLDIGSQDPMPGEVHSVAEALLLLLDSTAEPIIPYNHHNICLSTATNYWKCKEASTSAKHTSNNVLCVSAEPTAGSSRTGCSSLVPVEDSEGSLEKPVEEIDDPQPKNVLKRKYATLAQDASRQKINALQGRLSSGLLARDVQLDLDIENDLKKTRKELSKQKQIVMQLPEIRRTVFLYICAFLKELLNHTQDNGLDPKTLATLFGSIFLRDPPRSRDDRQLRNRTTQATFDRKKAAFVFHFLVTDQSDFLGR